MLAMDRGTLNAFLETDFAEVAHQFRVERADEAGLTLRLRADPMHLRPGGTVSGPAMFGLADVAVYLAILSRIGPRALTVTTNASIDFMRKPAAGVDLLAEVRLLKLGRSLAVGDALIFSAGSEAAMARAALTYAIPPERRSA
ncbi:PaaI family thioesterase [Limimaricola pyoseonensis]|uniref:Uncharacterized domain 1-containing protein n=1 Tax=Limimaricola pyoseonensis TaxID=521013 RepID=A0A1G7AGW3_9RHOB|nr:PaaI family thioesterase [Limimaricola pyoseonensis]SDE13970.1 uncharacterized domain 1-containing protein [Limimaricola pyoseonensis]